MMTKAGPAAPPPPPEPPSAVGRPAAMALNALRLIMILSIAALLVASATLLLYGVVETIRHIVRLVVPGPDGVLFLEQVFSWGSDRDLMPLGIGIAAVIFALSYFIHRYPEK